MVLLPSIHFFNQLGLATAGQRQIQPSQSGFKFLTLSDWRTWETVLKHFGNFLQDDFWNSCSSVKSKLFMRLTRTQTGGINQH